MLSSFLSLRKPEGRTGDLSTDTSGNGPTVERFIASVLSLRPIALILVLLSVAMTASIACDAVEDRLSSPTSNTDALYADIPGTISAPLAGYHPFPFASTNQ